jgi:hypothetical protein
MNELKKLAERLRKDADRAEAFSTLLDKYHVYDTEYNQIMAWFNHSQISAEEMKKILDSEEE